MKKLALAVLLLSAAAVTLAQAPRGAPTGDAERAAMAKLDYMAGRWEGEGWMDMGGGRNSFRGSETVQKKLRGVALLVEGDFTGKLGSTGQEAPVHTTLGVISYDAQAGKYHLASWLATGNSGTHDLTLTADGWQWELEIPQARIRYTARFSSDQWLEIGERSSDGTTWNQFFEMTLRKKP